MNKEDQIIQKARELFTTYGYKRVSMDEIANLSGVTKRTVYRYFKDKDELFEYFVKEELVNMKDIVEGIENKYDDAFDIIHNSIYELLKYKKNSKFLKIIEREAQDLKTTSAIKFSNQIDASLQDYIRVKLEKLIKENKIKKCNVELCSFIIYTVYISIIFKWSSDGIDENEITNTITMILKDGLFN